MSLRGPTRLADTQAASQPLRQALQDARRELPGPTQTRPLADRMQPWLDTPAHLGKAAGVESGGALSWFRAAATSTLAKIGLGAILGATAATVALRQPDESGAAPASRLHTVSQDRPSPHAGTRNMPLALASKPLEHAPPAAPSTERRPEVPEGNPEEGDMGPPQPTSNVRREGDDRHAHAAPRAPQRRDSPRNEARPSRSSRRNSPPPARGHADPAAELRLLRRAQDVLEREPERALHLARRHAKRFPDGMFVQEREVLAIEALLAQGKQEPARQRTVQFLAEHPGSTHAPRLRPLLQAESGANTTGGNTGSMSH